MIPGRAERADAKLESAASAKENAPPSVKSRGMLRAPTTATSEIIHGRQNARLKDLRKHFLRADAANDGLVAVEGRKLLQEAVRSGLRVHSIFVREGSEDEFRAALAGLDLSALTPAPAQFCVAAEAFNHACATDTPQGLAALVEAPRWSLESILEADRPLLLVLAGLQDPGNLGTIFRTAEAFGVSGVLLTPGTVNPWGQKVLRASAGSSFRLPVVALKDSSLLERLVENGIPLYACAAQRGTAVDKADLRGRVALAVGNEGSGISPEVLAHCSGTLCIPCPGPVESLNAAVAASVLLYEASRQRARASTRSRP